MKIKYKQKQKNKYFFVVTSSEIPFSYHSPKNQYHDQNGTNLALCLRKSESSPSEVFLGNGVLKICSKFTGERP